MRQTTAATRLIHAKSIGTSALLALAFATTLTAAPQLGLSAASIGPVHIFPGANGASQTVEAFNLGDGSLNLTPASSASWISAATGTPRACTTRSGSCIPVQISLNTSALAAGSYAGFVTVTDPNAIDSPQQITVTVNVAGIPSAVTLYVTPPGGPLPSVNLPLFTQGSVTGTAATQSGGDWLQFIFGALFQTGTPYSLQVASHKGLATGSYTGTVALSGANPADTKTVNVTMNVTNSPILVPYTTPVQLAAWAGGAKASTSVSLTNIGAGTLAISGATTSSNGNFLSALPSGGAVNITADPGTLAVGTYAGSVSIVSNAANNGQISIPVVFTVEPAGTPLIYTGGITNIGNFAADGAAPGDILAIFGDQLAAAGTAATNPGLPPLATTLGSVQVLVSNVPAPLYFVSPGQVNFQIPYEAPAGQTASVQIVSKGVPGNLRPLAVSASVPRLLVWPAGVIAGSYGIIVNQDGSLVLPAGTTIPGFSIHPAKAGDTITIYCTGLGETSPAGVTGAAATSSPLQSIGNVTVAFGGGFGGSQTTVPAAFAGLTPTAVGLYQVNATLPPDVPTGALVPVTVTVSLNGAPSNPVYIAVSQ